ncbi:hypothetical protein Ani05nite_50950 [Amorphoplanes nipponensis]|uniref:Uncharacterized protein n=1 Tax=Actinoplanes nipponensis TaxID=135950 RepID=A0A919MNG5_9ACTN|nr:hypothetical protein Ani05nite_50950 [Actinoplanes nipponensis]
MLVLDSGLRAMVMERTPRRGRWGYGAAERTSRAVPARGPVMPAASPAAAVSRAVQPMVAQAVP